MSSSVAPRAARFRPFSIMRRSNLHGRPFAPAVTPSRYGSKCSGGHYGCQLRRYTSGDVQVAGVLAMSFKSRFRWEAISVSIQPLGASRLTVAWSSEVQPRRGFRSMVLVVTGSLPAWYCRWPI